MSAPDAEALLGSLRRLRGPSPRTGVVRRLERALRAVDRVFGYRGASLMFAGENRSLRYVVAIDEAGRSLDRAQQAVGDGPCVAAYAANSPVTSPDVTDDPRWPGLARHLHPDVRAVAGVPVRLGRPVGTLNVYDTRPRRWGPADTASLQAYAQVIAELLDASVQAEEKSELAGRLQHALDHRVVIERAIGHLMGSHRLTADQAFAYLRKQARDSRRRVEDLAIELLDAQAEPRRARPDGDRSRTPRGGRGVSRVPPADGDGSRMSHGGQGVPRTLPADGKGPHRPSGGQGVSRTFLDGVNGSRTPRGGQGVSRPLPADDRSPASRGGGGRSAPRPPAAEGDEPQVSRAEGARHVPGDGDQALPSRTGGARSPARDGRDR